MRIRGACVEQMLAHARRGYPFEVCGALTGRRAAGGAIVERAIELENREAATPRVNYQIDPQDLIRIEREALNEQREIIGYYHSHPDHPARPSETDRRIAAEGLSDGVIHVVIGVDQGVRATPSAWIFREAIQAFEPEEWVVD